jgi:branched-chain amino acid transport system substrate-binding protein
MAVEDFGGKVLDKPIFVIVGDHQLKPDIGAKIARRWYDVEQVDLIVDVRVSAVGPPCRASPTTRRRCSSRNLPARPTFTGNFAIPTACNGCSIPRALAVGTAQEVVKRGGNSWFFITDDYAFGHSLERNALSVLGKTGGEAPQIGASAFCHARSFVFPFSEPRPRKPKS